MLERDAQLSQLRALLADVRRGSGRVVVIQGPPGIGKTTLAQAICTEATTGGMTALRARGSEFEREFAFGVARQLFEPLARDGSDLASGPARLAGAMFSHAEMPARFRSDFDVFHSLYWMCVNVAMRGPLVLSIDDAHWSDPPTLGWLRYLAHRIEDIGVLVLLTIRSDEVPDGTAQVLADIARAPNFVEITLTALSAEATGRLLQQAFGRVPDPAFVAAGHRATGGNPFLLTELARAMREEGIEPRGSDAWRIGSLRPQSIVRSIDARVRRLPSAAQSLAQAAAVFGTDAEFRHAAALAGLDVDQATQAADALLRASIIDATDPIRFEHSLIRDVILSDLTPARLARDHKRAADVLTAEGAGADRIAAHLLLATPVGDAGSARWLLKAAELALTRGAPASAVTYLERALLEPPAAPDRPRLLALLGRARLHAAVPGAIEALHEGFAAATDPSDRAAIAADLASALMAHARGRDAYDVLESALRHPDGVDRETALRLEAQMMAVAQLDHSLIPVVRERAKAYADLPGNTAGERLVLANVAYIYVNDGTEHDEVLRIARLAARGGDIVRESDPDAPASSWLIRTLHHLGEKEDAERLLRAMIEQAAATGSLLAYAVVSMGRAAQFFTFGDMRATEEETGVSAELAAQAGWRAGVPLVATMRAAVSVERADPSAGYSLFEGFGLLGDVPHYGVLDLVLFYRAAVYAALGETARALDDLFEYGRRERRSGSHYMSTQWRASAAPLLAAEGKIDDARALLDEELSVCRRRGTPRPIGIALRAAGIVEGRLDLLEESSRVLNDTPFPLELAKSELELGAALRRANRRTDARARLERAIDLAFRCGATAVQERAEQELASTGARPRRLTLTGVEALTPSERRVAQLAAGGRSNPEIAQALFISRKTVETHLGRAYTKLGIESRAELARALEPPDGH